MKIRDAKMSTEEVVWGFWPTYEDPANPIWRQEIRVCGEPIGMDTDLGEFGAVPLVVGRFNPVGYSPYGRGPGWKMLPTIRVMDGVAEMTLEGMSKNLDPAFVYAHDGMLDLSDGIEGGLGYPSMPGSADSVLPIGLVDNLDQAFFSEERLDEALRYGFFREVIQRGKTPPSASQYIGDEQKQLRRIARPAAKLWDEFGVGLLKRFEWLERQDGGSLQDAEFSWIEEGVITTRPISPLERAQAREDVLPRAVPHADGSGVDGSGAGDGHDRRPEDVHQHQGETEGPVGRVPQRGRNHGESPAGAGDGCPARRRGCPPGIGSSGRWQKRRTSPATSRRT